MLFQYFLFRFIELAFSEVSEQSKGRLVNVFYCSSENVGKDTVNFLSTLWNDLINSLFHNLIDIACCTFNYSWCNFTFLINNVSTGIGKIISIKKTTKLSFSFVSNNTPPYLLLSFFFVGTFLNFKCFGSTTRKSRGFFFFQQSYYLQKICLIFLSTSDFHLQRLLLIFPHWI